MNTPTKEPTETQRALASRMQHLFNSGHPSRVAAGALRLIVEHDASMVSKLAELEKEKKAIREGATRYLNDILRLEQVCIIKDARIAEQDTELARLRTTGANLAHADEKIRELQIYIKDVATPERDALRARVSELEKHSADIGRAYDGMRVDRDGQRNRSRDAEQRAERLADAGKRFVKVIVEREPMLEAAFHQSDVELDHNFGFHDRALIEAHQGFVAALADQPAQANTQLAALIAAGDLADGALKALAPMSPLAETASKEFSVLWSAAKQGAQPVENWICCSDRMPKDGERVIVSSPNQGVGFGAKEWAQGWNPDHWIVDGRRWEMKDVTHWMPIPTAPSIAAARKQEDASK